MDIRHKVETTRKVTGVDVDEDRRAYTKKLGDMWEVYPMKFWEPADVEAWTPVVVTVAQGSQLVDRGTHVASIVNKDYRFVLVGTTLTVEHRTA